MIILAANDTIAGVADAASQVSVTIFGMELETTGLAETYKTLYQGQLAASPATIYTATANGPSFIRSIAVVNNDSVQRTFQLFRGGTAALNKITPAIPIAPGGFALYEDMRGWQVFSSNGSLLTAYGPVNTLDNWGITNNKGETIDRNVCPEVGNTVITTGQLYMQLIWLPAGAIITNISLCSGSTAAGTPTHWCFALYSLAGALLGSTADQTSTAWGSNAMKTLALTAQYVVPASGLYYIAFMMVATTCNNVKGGTARTDGTLSQQAPIVSGVSATGYSTGTAPATATIPTSKVTTSMWACCT